MEIVDCPLRSCNFQARMKKLENAIYVVDLHVDGEHPRFHDRKLQARFCEYCGKAIGAKDQYYGSWVCIDCLGEIT